MIFFVEDEWMRDEAIADRISSEDVNVLLIHSVITR